MKRKLVTLLLVSATAVWGLSAGSSPASAAPVTQKPLTPPASCATPPAQPDATAANRDAFVAAWLPRVENKAWFTNFVGLSSVPQNILDEGFNAMNADTQAWMVACLVDRLTAASGHTSTQTDVAQYQLALDAVIFGKDQLNTLKNQVNAASDPTGPPSPAKPADPNMTKAALNGMISRLSGQSGITSASLPHTTAPKPAGKSVTTNVAPATPHAVVTPHAYDPNTLANLLDPILHTPLVQLVLAALDSLLKLISQIQAVLFTLPVLNLGAALFYKICAESATQPLACSISVPIGVPVPTDVTGDHFPDVLALLIPVPSGNDISMTFNVTRLPTAHVPLAAHIFFVYDVPLVNKRVEFGYDGRASTLANTHTTTVTLKNIYGAVVAGDINVQATVTSNAPGAVEALTFAVKDLVGGSPGHPPTEANPMAGAVQFSPMPTKLTMGAHLTHNVLDEDIFSLASSTQTTVNAVMTQDTTTTTPQSHRQFTALIDKLPTSIVVDLTHQGQEQHITYTASQSIAHIQATDTAVGDISHPGSYTRSVYDVLGVPTSISVELTGAQHVLYNASAVIPQVTFSTQTFKDAVLQQEIVAQAQGIPAQVQLDNVTGDTSTITYDASSVITSVAVQMYDLNMDQTNLLATATGIAKHMQFTMTKSTGVYDLDTDTGINLITATLTRGGPSPTVLLDPGVDHATIYKRGNEIGLDFQLSGFKSAHFENNTQKMIVGLGLAGGGQAFDAIADLDSPNILANAHITQLPSSITITDDMSTSTYKYVASGPINDPTTTLPDISASIALRDAGFNPTDTLSAGVTNIPAQMSIQLDSANSHIAYNASGTLGKIELGAHLSAATLSLPRGIDAGLTITSIPQVFTADYANGNIDFNVQSPGIGSIDAWVTNHVTHETAVGDFLAGYFDQPSGDLDAALHISNLQRVHFAKVTDGDGGGFVADLDMGNQSNFSFFATVNLGSPTVTTKLTVNGSLNPLPSSIHLESIDGRIRYQGNTHPTLTLSVGAGDPTGLSGIGALAMPTQGVIIRDGGTASNPAIAANILITGLPDSLDLNTPDGIYTVGNFSPTIPVITVDAALSHIVSSPLTINMSQDVGVGPVTFVFGPFVTSTDPDGTHRLSVNYTASRSMNAFDAEVSYGNSDDAMLHISNIPGGGAPSISVNTAFGATDKVDIDMTTGISQIIASYKHVGDATFGGVVQLDDVPSSVHLQLGSETTGDTNNGATAPQFTFTASSPGLDISAFAKASIVNASAVVTLLVSNMGSTVTGGLDGRKLNITSSPATDGFTLDASAHVHIDVSLDFDAGPFVNRGTLGVNIDVRDITIGFTGFTTIGLDLGVTTGLTGNWTSFTFGLDVDITLSIVDRLSFDFSLPIIGDESITLLTIGDPDNNIPAVFTFNNIIPNWHIQTNTFATIISLPVFEIPFIIECHVGVKARPGPGSDTGLNQFTLFAPIPYDGNDPAAYLITPGVFGLSGFIMDVIGFFESPYGNDIQPDIGCS